MYYIFERKEHKGYNRYYWTRGYNRQYHLDKQLCTTKSLNSAKRITNAMQSIYDDWGV